jgi:peptidoglycan/LPS O-acetylase OafA/YrhL
VAVKRRWVQLDGLRAFAVLAVFVHHALDVPLLWVGVDLFFVLSGFLITGILLRQRDAPRYFSSFYARRTVRIFPPYYLVLLVVFAIDATARADWPWYVLYVSNVRDAMLGAGSPMLNAMWSLAIEEQFYLLWPLLVYALGPSGMWRVCIALLFAAPVLRGVLTPLSDDFRLVYALLPTRIDTLAGGAALAIAHAQWPDRFDRFARRAPILCIVAVAIFLALTLRPDFRTSANSILFNTVGYSLIAIAMAGVVAWAVSDTTPRVLAWPPIVYVGTISYMVYLCHRPVLELVSGRFGPALDTIVSLAITLALASLSWFVLERPLQRYKDRRLSPAAPAAPRG